MPINLKYMVLIPLFTGIGVAGITVPLVYKGRNLSSSSSFKESILELSNSYNNVFKKEEIEKLFKNVNQVSNVKVPDEEWIEKFRNSVKVVRDITEINSSKISQTSSEFKCEHRESLVQMYLFYTDLKGKLQHAINSTQPSDPNVMTVLRNLDLIDWRQTEIKRIKDEVRAKRGEWGWGTWSENPFNKFFNREKDWKDAIKQDEGESVQQKEQKCPL